jgi:hypothetical protein
MMQILFVNPAMQTKLKVNFFFAFHFFVPAGGRHRATPTI